MPGFLCVHLGAGYHSEKYRAQYMELCKKACLKGIDVLRNGGDCIESACIATAIMEDSELSNAGIGSNLTWDGHVECDASVMNSLGKYGAVGAVHGVRNPVLLAREVCLARAKTLSLDRVPPCLLVGEGAFQWAKSQNVVTIDPKLMISGFPETNRIMKGDVPDVSLPLPEASSG